MLYAKFRNNFDTIYAPVEKVLAFKKTEYALIGLYELYSHGKTLILNDELQTAQGCYFGYHDALVLPHTPKEGDRALILGSGEGVSIDMVLKCGYEHIDAVDIDPQAISIYREHLKDWNNEIYDKTDKFNMHYQCCMQFMKEKPDSYYDYIVYDLDTDAQDSLAPQAIPECFRLLKKGGVLSAQDGHLYSQSITEPHAKNLARNNPATKVHQGWKFKHYIK